MRLGQSNCRDPVKANAETRPNYADPEKVSSILVLKLSFDIKVPVIFFGRFAERSGDDWGSRIDKNKL